MSKKVLVFVIIALFSFFLPATPTLAAEDPLAVANNKAGIHILSDGELNQAAELVNSNGGAWGYVIIPLQSGDKNLNKWQNFMNECKKLRIIPIIRLATESDPKNKAVWREPNPADIIDYANFLDALEWPTKNRYVIVFNEVNRADEWGGAANPSEYAELLSFSSSVFKSKSSDFFMISAGMDNAAPEQGTEYMNQYNYLKRMNDAVPGIFNQIDGISSHSYPNPGFEQPPDTKSTMGTGSFIHERALIASMSNKELPVFITETGWSAEEINEEQRAKYYEEAFKTVWNDPGIVTVMPFLLQASAGPFQKFTFINADGSKTKQYDAFKNMQKVQGVPSFPTKKVLAAKIEPTPKPKDLPKSESENKNQPVTVSSIMQDILDFITNR